MPIVDVEIVGELNRPPTEKLTQALADAAGEALRSGCSGTWVRLRFLSKDHYAENGDAAEGIAPVFVYVIQGRTPAPERLMEQTLALTQSIASICGRPPENVHVIYEPEGRGRVAFGGKLVE